MSRRLLPVLSFISVAMLMALARPSLAFDDDKAISDVRLKDESFLDINAHSFRKSLDLDWLTTLRGWRMGGGSTSTNRTFVQADLRLRHEFSQKFQFGLELEHDHFYAPKSFPLPLIFADVYPSSDYDIGISFLGTPAYDKRQSDLGFALTFGRKPMNYLRLSSLKVDMTYNEKNEFDESYYEQPGKLLMLDAAYRISSAWEIYFDMERDTPLEFVFDDQVSFFEHEAFDYRVNIVYRRSIGQAFGINLRSMLVDKRLLQGGSDEYQKIEYQSLDVYWINSRFRQNRELTFGLRYDDFLENLCNELNPAEDYKFVLSTWQAYSSMFHSYSVHQAWDIGLYLGWSERSREYVETNPETFDDGSFQGKLRLSWQYHSIDKNSVFLMSMTLNLDDLAGDPGDGGGMYFQSSF